MTRVETTKETMFEAEVHRPIQFRRQQRDGRTFAICPALTQRRPLARFSLGRHPPRRRRASPPPTKCSAWEIIAVLPPSAFCSSARHPCALPARDTHPTSRMSSWVVLRLLSLLPARRTWQHLRSLQEKEQTPQKEASSERQAELLASTSLPPLGL
jgi:hypothetical protein